MNRIDALVKLIDRCQCVFDVGSDHALLSISLLSKRKCQHVINIDNKRQPLQIGIKNLKKYHLLPKTTNILNNGLKQITKKTTLKPSYIVCSGLGTKTIISILKTCDKNLLSSKFILLTHKDVDVLRKWLDFHSFVIKKELTFVDNMKFYQVILASFSESKSKTKANSYYYFFGQYNKQICLDSWEKMLHFYKNKIIRNNLHVYNSKYKKMLLIINMQLSKKNKNEN